MIQPNVFQLFYFFIYFFWCRRQNRGTEFNRNKRQEQKGKEFNKNIT